jgi:hypothetical protein
MASPRDVCVAKRDVSKVAVWWCYRLVEKYVVTRIMLVVSLVRMHAVVVLLDGLYCDNSSLWGCVGGSASYDGHLDMWGCCCGFCDIVFVSFNNF